MTNHPACPDISVNSVNGISDPKRCPGAMNGQVCTIDRPGVVSAVTCAIGCCPERANVTQASCATQPTSRCLHPEDGVSCCHLCRVFSTALLGQPPQLLAVPAPTGETRHRWPSPMPTSLTSKQITKMHQLLEVVPFNTERAAWFVPGHCFRHSVDGISDPGRCPVGNEQVKACPKTLSVLCF